MPVFHIIIPDVSELWLTLADAAELLTAIPAEVVLLRCRWLPAIPPPALGGVVRVLEWLLISDEETLRGRGTGRLPRVPVRLPTKHLQYKH